MAESQTTAFEEKKKPSSNIILYVIIGILVICIIAMGINSGMFSTKENCNEAEENEEEQDKNGYIEIDAQTLGYEFSQNLDTAERKYLNKNVKITSGSFYKVYTDKAVDSGEVIGQYIIIFGKSDMDNIISAGNDVLLAQEIESEAYPRRISCYPTDKNDLQGHKMGDKITITGKVLEYSGYGDGDGIHIENCDVL